MKEEVEQMTAVGGITAHSVRIWLRAVNPGPLELVIWPAASPDKQSLFTVPHLGSEETDWTTSFQYPDDFPSAPPLQSLTRYCFRVGRDGDGSFLAEGRFETAPEHPDETPERFSFAFLSCHQPYGEDGTVLPEAARMMKVLEPALEQHDVKYVLMIGDQMYSDYPPSQSFFREEYFRTISPHGEESILDCEPEEILQLYYGRYRHVWNHREFIDFQARYPTYCILDDHEIVDNWGSSSEHNQPEWQKLGRAARKAFFDYQASRGIPRTAELPASFHQQFRYGNTATFITDMRSQRKVFESHGQIFGDDQFAVLERFLQANEDCHVLFVVITVPILHVPDWLADLGVGMTGEGSDLSDRWSWWKNVGDRNRLLSILRRHGEANPDQRLVLLSGDIHLGCAFTVHWDGQDEPGLYQFISSGFTNVLDLLMSATAEAASMVLPRVDVEGAQFEAQFCEPAGSEQENPFPGLNFGVVEVSKYPTHSTVRFKLITHGGEDEPKPVVVFDSGEL